MLLDEYLPTFDYNEIHQVQVNASAENTYTAIKELKPADLSPLVFWMLNLRMLPARLAGRPPGEYHNSNTFLEQLYQGGFIPLADMSGEEVVFGLIGQFWKPVGGVEAQIASPQAFLDFNDPAFARVAANLAASAGDGSVCLSTETRIQVPDPATRRKFAVYWRLISLGSGWLRLLWLRAIKRKAEGM